MQSVPSSAQWLGDGGLAGGRVPSSSRHPTSRPATKSRKEFSRSGTRSGTPPRPGYVLCVAVTVLAYWNSLDGEFVHDDLPAITANPDVTNLATSSWTPWISHDFWGKPMSDPASHKSYRPLTTMTFRLNMALGGLSVRGYHVVNIALHCLAVCMVLAFSMDVMAWSPEVSTLAALLFSTHPVHTEAVSNLVGRADVLCCVFYLTSLHAFLRCPRRPWLLILSVTAAGLALLSKEQGITVLVVSLGYQLLTLLEGVWRRKEQDNISPLMTSKEFCTNSCVLLISLLLMLALRLWILHGALPQFSDQDNPAAFHPCLQTRFLTYCYLVVFNMWLLVCPVTLSYDWQLGSIPLVRDIADPRNLATLLGMAAMSILLWHTLIRATPEERRRLYFGISMGVVPFLPASNLLVTVGFVVAERVLYIPSVGFCLLVTEGLHRILDHRSMLVRICTGVLLALFLWRTLARNAVWASREALFKSGLESVPSNAKVHYNYANLQKDLGNVQLAIRHYKQALRLWPDHASAHNNLGTLLEDQGELHFQLALQIDPRHAKAHLNLANIYSKRGETDEALTLLKRSIQLDPSFAAAHSALASLFADLGDMEAAGHYHQLAVSLDPGNPDALNNYGAFLQKTGQSSAAVEKYREAIALQPNHTVALVNAAKTLGSLDLLPEAEALYNRALSILEDPDILDSLGVLYISTGRQRDARELYAHLYDTYPEHLEGTIHYAQVLMGERQYGQAETLLLGAVACHPDHRPALRLLASLYSRLNKTTEALTYIGRALSQCDDPRDCARLHADQGDILKDMGDFDSAQNSYRMAILLDPNLAHAHFNLAVIHHIKGKFWEAERHYQAAYSLDTSHKLVLENMEKLRKSVLDHPRCWTAGGSICTL